MEQEETTVCPVCGGSNIYESGEYLGCADCHRLNGGAAVSSEDITLHDLRIMFEQALKTNEALRERADLVDPLQERCELLGRALAALWSLVGEDDQRAITALLDPSSGKTMPVNELMRMLARKDAIPRAEEHDQRN